MLSIQNPPCLSAPKSASSYISATGHLKTVDDVIREVHQEGSLRITKDQLVCLTNGLRWNNAAKRVYSKAWRRLYGNFSELCIQTLPQRVGVPCQVYLTVGHKNCGEYDSTRDRILEEIADELLREHED